ncbi:sugar ABC transporter ATP-binding protein [Jannaschia seohaensis]|uniref:Ribose transport system ATP-binding protein n=1 Tax=Jannaschia seohaensis TaxID=475081 RepID=A0A2Y9A5S4_9RHOB|nr:sugar ABC transporter ATP-binding protein [Jannaschia seohaensis]PWJ21651.1 ribose transport system ATP-binding protein [Jannaschia seohaensis]SSA37929.1 ribose transport system ATP-binding protein [Jannaschia seohaensis]
MATSPSPIVRLEGVTKRYGATVALDGVNFDCNAGEIHAVLGENGAGKSTLMKIIAGVIQPTEGVVHVDGEPVALRSPREAVSRGLVCMFQELSLIPDLTVRENLMLGAPGTGLGRLSGRTLTVACDLLARIDGGHIPMRARLADLSLAERQQVEIAKALAREPRLLILDEATSALNASVVEKVFTVIREESARGIGVLFISHRFHEIEALADRVSVFRNGRHVETFDNGAYDYPAIINKMVGQKIDDLFPAKPEAKPDAEVVLRLDGFGWEDGLKDVSITLRKGCITGLGGLDGQGQARVLQGLFGLLRKTEGDIVLDGREIQIASPKDAKRPDISIALVPEDRKTEALVLQQSIAANMQLAALGVDGVPASDPVLYRPYIDALQLKYASLDQPVGQLSGGNQQKVALTKWLALKPRCLLLADPTRGIDVKTKTQIYELLRRLADEGTAILLLSTDYEEFIHLCDETHIFYDGRVVRHLQGDAVTAENILAATLNLPAQGGTHA